jgi:hypothetical protein
MRYDRLDALVAQLRSEGIDARHDIDIVTGRNQHGITVMAKDGSGEFFKLDELNTNADLLAVRDFAGILARRSPGTHT